MKSTVCASILLLVLMAPMAALADVCDDINEMADGWHDMANAIDDMADEGFTQDEADEVNEMIQEVHDVTKAVADLLEEEGDDEEAELGADLNSDLANLRSARGADEVVDAMDDVVDTLDVMVEYCDAH